MNTTIISNIGVTSAEFIAAAQNNALKRGYFVVTDNGVDTTFDASMLQSFTVSRYACPSSQFTLGSVAASEFHATVLSEAIEMTSIDGVTIKPYVGFVCTHNGQTGEAYIQLGKYVVDGSQTQRHGMFTEIVAYDALYSKTLEAPVSSEFLSLFSQASNPRANVSLFATNTGLDIISSNVPNTGNSPILINSEMTNREVLSRLAVNAGANCTTNSTGQIIFVYPTQTQTAITPSNYTSLTVDDKDITNIGYLLAEFDVDEETVESSFPEVEQGIGLSFDATYFTYGNGVLQTIYNRAKDTGSYLLSYQGFSIDVFSLCFIEPMDKLTVQDIQHNVYPIMPLLVEVLYNGNISVHLEAKTLQADSDNTSTAGKINSTSNRLSKAINNVNNKVTKRYAVCDTVASTATKVINLSGFSIFTGSTLSVKFTQPNEVANVSLNVNGATAQVRANGEPIKVSSVYNWGAGTIVDFMYDGTYWQMLGSNVPRFVKFVDSVGLVVSQKETYNEGFYVSIGADNISLANGSNVNMRIGTEAIHIGPTDDHNVTINQYGMYIENGDFDAHFTNNGELDTDTTIQRSSVYRNDTTTSPNNTEMAWIKRENGHFSLKVV